MQCRRGTRASRPRQTKADFTASESGISHSPHIIGRNNGRRGGPLCTPVGQRQAHFGSFMSIVISMGAPRGLGGSGDARAAPRFGCVAAGQHHSRCLFETLWKLDRWTYGLSFRLRGSAPGLLPWRSYPLFLIFITYTLRFQCGGGRVVRGALARVTDASSAVSSAITLRLMR